MSGRAAEADAVPSSDPRVIRLDGVFDVSAAQRLARELAEAGEAEVRIDLTRVREFHDFGIALLARELSGRVRTTVSGLRQHHIRLLRYLGIDAATPAAVEPAELA
jgi:ABC-type transporter Mla MlaB component